MIIHSNTILIDSTAINITKFYYKNQYKVLKKYVSLGHTTIGKFYGFKLHLVTDLNGNLINFELTLGKTHDLTLFKEQFLSIIQLNNLVQEENKILADKGYRNKNLHNELKNNGIFIDMNNKRRWKIESIFNLI